MSARKLEATSTLPHVTIEARQARLSLTSNSVILRRNGIEFRSAKPFPAWKEMTMTLQSPRGDGRVHCSGVVIGCTGNKHTGYHVSVVFTSLSRQAQARLSLMPYS